jgi:zinc transport system substrate-binding protein
MRFTLLFLIALTATPVLAERLPVAVSVLPQKTFVEAIGDGAVEVMVMVGKGYNPALYQPSPRQLGRLARARLYVRAGVPFEKSWMSRFRTVNPGMEILDMREGLALIPLESGQGDPHVWTDPQLVKQHARRLRDTLIRLDPAHQQTYEAGYRDLVRRLDELDRKLARKLAPLKGKNFLVFHPAWSYFARRYGLKQLSVEHEGKEPNAWSLARLIDRAKSLDIHTIIIQPQHSNATARVIAKALEAQLVEVDPLDEDYFGTLHRLAEVLREAAS